MRTASLLVHLLLVLGCRKNASSLARGEPYLVIDGFSVQRYVVATSNSQEVTGELFDRFYTHSRDVVIPVSELGTARCPEPGKIALLKTTAELWDIALTLGTDGERCYVQQQDHTSQREPREVFELPPRIEPRVATLRTHFERRWERRTWILRRPTSWKPEPGSDVVLALGESTRVVKVLERRPGAVRLPLSPGRSGEPRDNWYSQRRVAPLPSSWEPPADGAATLCLADDKSRCLEAVPPASAELPVVSFSEADIVGRSLLVDDLLDELGAIHIQRTKPRPGWLVYVRPSGMPVAEARYEIAFAADAHGDYSSGWILDRVKEPTVKHPASSGPWPARSIPHGELIGIIERLALATQATAFNKVGSEVLFLYDVRVVLPDAERSRLTLSRASARIIDDLRQTSKAPAPP